MNKNVVIIILALVIIGVGAYFFAGKSTKTSDNKITPAIQNKTESADKTIQGTLKSLLSAGKSQKCTYSKGLESASISGTVYVADGKMRGEFVSGAEEKKVNGYMIVDGKNSYVWTDLSKQGIKMAYDQNEKVPTGVPTDASSQATALNQAFEYVCQGWTKDDSLFTPPADITFSEFTMPSGAVIPSGTETNTSACSACNNLPEGEAKDTCKTQLNCK